MARAEACECPGASQVSWSHPKAYAELALSVRTRLELDSQTKLNTSRLVALSKHFAKRGTAPVCVWIAPKMPIEDITELALKTHAVTLRQSEALGEADVLIVVRKTANMSVT